MDSRPQAGAKYATGECMQPRSHIIADSLTLAMVTIPTLQKCRVKFFSVFLCQGCREVWQLLAVNYWFEVPWTWEKESRGPKPKSLEKVSKKSPGPRDSFSQVHGTSIIGEIFRMQHFPGPGLQPRPAPYRSLPGLRARKPESLREPSGPGAQKVSKTSSKQSPESQNSLF